MKNNHIFHGKFILCKATLFRKNRALHVNKKFLFLIVNVNSFIIISSIAANGIKCYSCFSSKSFENCDGNKTEVICPPNKDRCFKNEIVYGSTKEYEKGCQLKSVCDDKDVLLTFCKAFGGSTCEADCYDEDLCNGGVEHMVSVLLMVACALIAFFR